MQRIADRFGAECMASVPFGDELVVVGRAGRPHPRRPLIRVGDRRPLIPPLGVMYVAWSPPDEVEQWLSRLGDDVALDQRDLHEQSLRGARALGYTVGLEQSAGLPNHVPVSRGSSPRLALNDRGRHPIAYIAAAAFDAQRRVALVINVDGFPDRLTLKDTIAAGEYVRDAALVITRLGGGQPPWEQLPG